MRKLFALLLTALLLCATGAAAFAYDVPDLSRQGSIQVTMRHGEDAVGGGSLTLYRVGAVQEDDGNYGFALTEDFSGSGASLEEVQSSELAGTLADYAAGQGLSGTTAEIGQDGTASFDALEPGLYLLVQDEAAGGYEKAEPFLVSVPLLEDGAYVYDVDASPKVGELTESAPPVEPVTPEPPAGPKLPQTGQLNWPVPVLAVLGLALFSVGWVLRFGKKGGHEG